MKIEFHPVGSIVITCLCSLLLFAACNSNTSEKNATPATSSAKKDTSVEEKKVVTVKKRPHIINITHTVSSKKTELCLRDSSATIERI